MSARERADIVLSAHTSAKCSVVTPGLAVRGSQTYAR